MEALIYFALWAGFIFLMMRLGCGAHVMGHGRGHGSAEANEPGLPWTPPVRDTDPVCGKIVRTDHAKPSVHEGKVYYFCSRDCREIFEAAPNLYLGRGNADEQPMEYTDA